MTNEDLKRFYQNNPNMEEPEDFVRLDSTGKIPVTVLPQYVDDVVEGYFYNDKFYEDSQHTKEITGEIGKLYVDILTNDLYRFGGTIYVKVSDKGRGIVIDIGNGQYTPEEDTHIYPTLDVTIARQIYSNDKLAINQILKWTLIDEANLRVIQSDKQTTTVEEVETTTYFIIVFVNNAFIKFTWNDSTEGTINPEILS